MENKFSAPRCLVTLALCVVFMMCLRPSPAADIPSLTVLATAYQQQQSSLKSLYVAYDARSELLASPQDVREYLHTIHVLNEQWVFAFKGNKRYVKLSRPDDGIVEDILDRTSGGEPVTHSTGAPKEWAFDDAHLYMLTQESLESSGIGSITPRGRLAEDDSRYFTAKYMSWIFRGLPDSFGGTV